MRNFLPHQIYHVLNRGVDKRKIFLDETDHLRFVHNLFEFNDVNSINNNFYSFRDDFKSYHDNDIASRYNKKPRKLLVDVLAFVLMPNHYHLLLKPRYENSITNFMKKINIGYAKYFNEKYQRVGTLFQGRYKAIQIIKDSHFIHIPHYIHLNPLDLKFPEWRERKIKSHKEALRYIKNYRWSSFLDYIGIKNFPSVTQRNYLLDFFGNSSEVEKYTTDWLKDIEWQSLKHFSLES